jgi:tRNA A-37 threonylcarbamoyl transferase component Bud32
MAVLLKFSDGTLKQDGSGETPLHVAVNNNATKCLELLIAKTQSKYVRVKNMLGDKPRDIAEKKRRTKCIEILLSVNFPKQATYASRPLHTTDTVPAFAQTPMRPQTKSFDKDVNDLSGVHVPAFRNSSGLSDVASFASENIAPFFEESSKATPSRTDSGELFGVLGEYLPVAGKVFKLIGGILSLVHAKGENDEFCTQFEKRYNIIKHIIKDNCKRKIDATKFAAIQNLVGILVSLQKLIAAHTKRLSFVQIFTSKSFKKEYERLDDMVSKNLHVLQVGMSSEILDHVTNINTSMSSLLEKINSFDSLVLAAQNKSRVDSMTEDGAIEIPIDKLKRFNNSQIASGGQGKIYRVEYGGQLVAQKIIETGGLSLSDLKRKIKSFRTEVNILMALRHPRIIQIYGIVTTIPNELSIIMRYAERGDLRKLLDTKDVDLNEKQRMKLMIQIGEAMDHLHEKCILHRDLKSLNVLIDHNSDALVTDFGLSFATDLATTINRSKPGGGGSARWTAPECFAGDETFVFNKPCDVYSFGIVMYEILTRNLPWHDFQEMQVAAQVIQNRRPKPPPIGQDRCYDKLRAGDILMVLDSAWHADPAQRPTFTKLVAELKRVDNGLVSDGLNWMEWPVTPTAPVLEGFAPDAPDDEK